MKILESIFILSVFFCVGANAAISGYQLYTPHYLNYMGNCYPSIGTFLPQANVKKIIIDNSVPNGTVLHSWEYDILIGRGGLNCTLYDVPPYISYNERIDYKFKYNTSSEGYFHTNNPGVGLRVYATSFVPVNNTPEALTLPSSIRKEVLLSGNGSLDFSINTISMGNGLYGFPEAKYITGVKYRAELVKIGKMDFSGDISSLHHIAYLGQHLMFEFNSHDQFDQILVNIDGYEYELGVDLLKPSCRLSAPANYNVDLGSFRAGSSLPKYGDVKPIVIGLDCNGKPNNVDISFQDGSTSSLSNGSVRLHNTAGSPIDGLEAQMTYNGAPIAVNKSTVLPNRLTKISLGSLGQSQSQSVVNATFGVRFVQRAPIVHVGPVKGTVNMFVTYN